MTWERAWRRVCGAGLVLVLSAVNGGAVASPQRARALESLDEWIVLRFRGAQLLPDSAERGRTLVVQSGAPHIETLRTSARRDTLVALHFNATYWRPAFATGANVRLVDPTGAVSAVAGRITARRAFRAPRKPGARNANDADWRVGWAFLVAIPMRSANAAPSGFDNWSLLELPGTAGAKALPKAPPVTP